MKTLLLFTIGFIGVTILITLYNNKSQEPRIEKPETPIQKSQLLIDEDGDTLIILMNDNNIQLKPLHSN